MNYYQKAIKQLQTISNYKEVVYDFATKYPKDFVANNGIINNNSNKYIFKQAIIVLSMINNRVNSEDIFKSVAYRYAELHPKSFLEFYNHDDFHFDLEYKIKELIKKHRSSDKKFFAIKEAMTTLNCSLLEAKRLVEKYWNTIKV